MLIDTWHLCRVVSGVASFFVSEDIPHQLCWVDGGRTMLVFPRQLQGDLNDGARCCD
jgi:hypothetical protein